MLSLFSLSYVAAQFDSVFSSTHIVLVGEFLVKAHVPVQVDVWSKDGFSCFQIATVTLSAANVPLDTISTCCSQVFICSMSGRSVQSTRKLVGFEVEWVSRETSHKE